MVNFPPLSSIRIMPIPKMHGDTGRDPRHSLELAKIFMEETAFHDGHVQDYEIEQLKQKLHSSDAAARRRFGLDD